MAARRDRPASALKAPHEFAAPEEFKAPDGRVVASVHGLRDAVDQLKRLSKPFLNWTGKAERLSFDVPTLPLFVHERLIGPEMTCRPGLWIRITTASAFMCHKRSFRAPARGTT